MKNALPARCHDTHNNMPWHLHKKKILKHQVSYTVVCSGT